VNESYEAGSPGLVTQAALATAFSDFAPAITIEAAVPGADPMFNTPDIEGCPFVSRDGKKFFMASNRPGGEGGIDIWVSTRSHRTEPWGEPVNVGSPVNSAANDFCPTLARNGHTFYFVSTRSSPDACGGGDIYVTRLRNDGEFDEPRNLGCTVNSEYNEFSPFPLPQSTTGPVLYFSSTRPRAGGTGGDIYMTESHGGVFGAPQLVPGVNSLADDGHPNVRRDGLEIFFYSQRSDLPGAQGGPDIFMATRASTSDAWSTPVNLGPDINSPFSETRPSLSWRGTRLYFGSNRLGSSDIFVATRK
jgi:Tol biopolymer transport system component